MELRRYTEEEKEVGRGNLFCLFLSAPRPTKPTEKLTSSCHIWQRAGRKRERRRRRRLRLLASEMHFVPPSPPASKLPQQTAFLPAAADGGGSGICGEGKIPLPPPSLASLNYAPSPPPTTTPLSPFPLPNILSDISILRYSAEGARAGGGVGWTDRFPLKVVANTKSFSHYAPFQFRFSFVGFRKTANSRCATM